MARFALVSYHKTVAIGIVTICPRRLHDFNCALMWSTTIRDYFGYTAPHEERHHPHSVRLLVNYLEYEVVKHGKWREWWI